MRSDGEMNSEMRKLDNIDRWLDQVEQSINDMGKSVRETRESFNKTLSDVVDKHKLNLKKWESDFSKEANNIVLDIKNQYVKELKSQANRALDVLQNRTCNRIAEINSTVEKFGEYR